MNFRKTINNDSYFGLVLLHIGFGILFYLLKPITIVFFFGFLAYFLIKILYAKRDEKVYQVFDHSFCYHGDVL